MFGKNPPSQAGWVSKIAGRAVVSIKWGVRGHQPIAMLPGLRVWLL
jgi:hypothetical protein